MYNGNCGNAKPNSRKTAWFRKGVSYRSCCRDCDGKSNGNSNGNDLDTERNSR